MPVQTTQGTNIYFPDGAMVSVQTTAGGAFEDVGAINSAVTATYQWDESEVDTANYGKLKKSTRNHRIEGGFTLINLNPAVVQKMGGGLFEVVETVGSEVTTIPDQVIAAGWDDNISYPLIAKTSSTDSTELKLTAKPTLTSVKKSRLDFRRCIPRSEAQDDSRKRCHRCPVRRRDGALLSLQAAVG